MVVKIVSKLYNLNKQMLILSSKTPQPQKTEWGITGKKKTRKKNKTFPSDQQLILSSLCEQFMVSMVTDKAADITTAE